MPSRACRLQKVADGIGAVLAKVELVIQIIHRHHGRRLSFRLMGTNDRRQRACEILMRNHHDLAARLRAVPVRGMVRVNSSG